VKPTRRTGPHHPLQPKEASTTIEFHAEGRPLVGGQFRSPGAEVLAAMTANVERSGRPAGPLNAAIALLMRHGDGPFR
jgi:hypothetical protein